METPKSIQTERLLLRCWQSEDAKKLLPILESNVDHLKEWIPERISAPAPLPELKKRLKRFAKDFNSSKEFRFAIFSLDEEILIGEVSLFPRSENGRVQLNLADRVEIGYWLRSDVTGRGYATEASKAMMDFSIKILKMKRIEIHHNTNNLPSASVPKRLGFTLSEIAKGGDKNKMLWYIEIDSE